MTTTVDDGRKAPSFDLTPDPRVLQILGEISLDQWKCLSELVDNSVDAFINTRRSGTPIAAPEISITLPTADREDAAVSVRDNGPGMSISQLESAVKAGWSGNNPLDNLGLFGMGFNIATARLGLVTEVYTTLRGDSEWTGLRIDLNELRRTRSYHTPRLTRPKSNPEVHGTEIRVMRLKADQRVFFAKNANLQKLKKQLSRIYAPLLLNKESTFTLKVNGQTISPRRQCHWDPQRSVQGPDGVPVHAVEAFDFELAKRRYCMTCLTTFGGNDNCPTIGPDCRILDISRRLHGWLGVQRYMHEEDFGVDLIRNGRVIEIQNKDLFVWSGEERPEREYPIDDQRNRGRFIGEIHLDHCRVSYTKDRFERDDPSWAEMVSLVRGEGPLQPQKARKLGFGPQDAPLFRLFQVFRRSSPQGKTGRWSRILAVKNNERAIEMSDLFHKGDPDYQTDEKWFDLVEEEDRALVGASPATSSPSATPTSVPSGFLDDEGKEASEEQLQAPGDVTHEPQAPLRQRVHDLSRVYKHPLLKIEFNVEAFAVEPNDPSLPLRAPWALALEDPGTRTFLFLFSADHPAFRSMTLTPMDGLLSELALRTYEFLKDTSPGSAIFASILADLRAQYARDGNLESRELIGEADARLRELSLSISSIVDGLSFDSLFASLNQPVQDQIRRKIAAAGAASFQTVIGSGEFLGYADYDALRDFVRSHPDLFFDGRFWDQPYLTLDYGSQAINEEVRLRILGKFDGYIQDAIWLANQSPRDLDRSGRDEVIRASMSLRLLRSDEAN